VKDAKLNYGVSGVGGTRQPEPDNAALRASPLINVMRLCNCAVVLQCGFGSAFLRPVTSLVEPVQLMITPVAVGSFCSSVKNAPSLPRLHRVTLAHQFTASAKAQRCLFQKASGAVVSHKPPMLTVAVTLVPPFPAWFEH